MSEKKITEAFHAIVSILNDPFKEAGLTDREKEVVKGTYQGYTRDLVASMLNISPSTVKTLASRAQKKIGVVPSLWTAAVFRKIGSIIEDAQGKDK